MMHMQISVYFTCYEVADKLLYGRAVWVLRIDFSRTEFCFGLALEYRVLHRDRYRRYKSHTNIGILHIFTVKLADTFAEIFAECTLMSPAVYGMLPIYKRIILFAILVCMSKSYLYIVVFEVYDRIQRVVGDFLVEQVEQPVLRSHLTAVEADR